MSTTVRLRFNDGTNNYTLPHIFQVTDPKEGMKATVIAGNRSDGSIVIPGGKRSQLIEVRGNLFDSSGYIALTTLINEMRTKVSTAVATLTLEHYNGATWVTDWSYTVRRIDEINFAESLRLDAQEYSISFLVLAY